MSGRLRKIIVGVMKVVAATLMALAAYLAYNLLTASGAPPPFLIAASFLAILLLVLGILGLLS